MLEVIASQLNDRRRSGRWVIVKPALIIPGDGVGVRCLTVDWGAGGALLEAKDCEPKLEVFNLLIAGDDMLMACRVTRRSAGRIGVQFSSIPMRVSRFGPIARHPAKGSVTGLMQRGGVISSKYRERA